MRKNKTNTQLVSELDQANQRIAELEARLVQDGEDHFSKIFHASPAQMALTDLGTGKYIEVNKAFLTILGFSRDEVIGKTAVELNLFANTAQRAELLQRMGAQGYLRDEYVLVRANSGELRHGIFAAEFIQTNGQKLILTVMNDITAIKQAEERWQFALESAGDGLWDWNLQTNRVFYSRQWKAMLDYDEAEIGDSLDEWASRVHPDDLADTMEKIEAHLSGKTPIYSSEHRIRGKDGMYLWVLDQGKILEWTEDRKPLRVIGTHKNITERKVMETKLRESEERFSRVFHANPAVQLIVSVANGKILDVNKAFCEQTGYTPEELIGRTTQEINFWQDPAQQQNMLQQLRAQGHLHDIEIDFRTKAGGIHTLLLSFQVIEINHDRYIVSSGVDISERKRAEQALRKSEQLYHSLIEMLDVSLCRWLPDTTLTYTNEKYKKIFGVEGEAIGKKWLDYLPEETRLTTATFYAKLAENPETVMYEHPVTVEDGDVRQFQWIDTPLLDEQGEVIEFQSVGVDIHERTLAEIALRENEARLQGILEAAPDAMLVIAPDGKILMSNAQTEKAFGYMREELIGSPVENLVPIALRIAHVQNRADFLAVAQPITTGIDRDVFALRKNGETFPAEISLSYHQQAGSEAMVLCSVRDVTEQRRIRELLAAQRDLARLLQTNLSKEEVWHACFMAALKVSGLDSGGIYLFNPDQRTFELVQHTGLSPTFIEQVASFAESTPSGQMMLSGKPLYFTRTSLNLQPYHIEEGLLSIASLPIQHQGEILGCLNIASHTFSNISEEIRTNLEVIALEISNIILHIRTTEALEASREQLSQTLVAARMGTWRWHIPTGQMVWSPEASHIFGIEFENADFGSVLERFHPDDRTQLITSIQKAFSQKEMLNYEYRVFNPDQTMFWVTNYGHIYFDKEEHPLEVLGLVQDITERKLAENALIAREKQLNSLVDSQTHFMIRVNMEGKYSYCNTQFEKEFGWLFDEQGYANTYAFATICENHRQRMQEVVEKCFAEPGKVFSVEIDKPAKDGGVRNTLWEVMCITDEKNQPVEVQCMGIEITDRKRAEQALSDSEELYRLTLSNISDAVLISDPTGNFTFVCPNVDILFGYSQAEVEKIGNIVGLLGQEVFVPEELALSGEIRNIEHTITDKAGCLHDVLITAKQIDLKGGTVLYTFHDISERKQAEEKLRQSEALLKEAQRVGRIGHLEWTAQNRESKGSDELYRIFEITQDGTPFSHNTLKTMISDEDQKRLHEIDIQCFANHTNPEYEYEVTLASGKTIWIHQLSQITYNEHGRPERMLGIYQDITPQKQAVEALRESEAKYRSLIDSQESAISTIDAEGVCYYMNGNGAAPFGTPEDVIGKKLHELFPPHVADWQLTQVREVITTGEGIVTEYPSQVADKFSWCRVSVQPIYLADGTVRLATVNSLDITERKRAEEELRLAEKRYRALIENAPDGIVLLTTDGDFKYASPTAEKLTGYSQVELRQMNARQMTHPEETPIVTQALNKVIQNPENKLTIQHRFQNKKGEWRWVESTLGNLMTLPGVEALIINFRDITERRFAEHALRASEEKYRGLMESLDSVIATIDANGTFLYMNDLAGSNLGGRPADFIGKNMYDLFPQIYAEQQMASILKVIRTDQALIIENQNFIQGQMRWYRSSLQPIHDDSGKVSYVLLNVTDIDNLKTAQHELQRLNQSLEEKVQQRTAEVQDLYDNAPIGYHSLNAEGQLIAINQTELDWLGYTPEELLGEPAAKIFQLNDAWDFVQNFKKFKATGLLSNQEMLALRKDGTTFPVMLNATAIYDENGVYVSSRSTMTDITQLKLAENELKRNINFTNTLLNAIPTPVFYKNKHGQYLGCNRAFTEFTGKASTELIGKSMHDLWPQQLAESYHDQDFELLQTEMRNTYESAVLDRDGVTRPVISVKDIFHDESGQVAGVVGAFVDITEQKYAEDALRLANIEMERAMRMKDEFLANMSHELRTPLNAILGLSESLSEQIIGPLNERQLFSLQTIEASGQHLLDLINDILDLAKLESHQMTLDLATIRVQEVCEASLVFIKEIARKKFLQVTFTPDPAVGYIEADERRLKQMLVNLLSNAVKFTPEGGRIELQVTGDPATRTIRFIVHDTGIGIAPENLFRLFRPFVQLDSGLNRQYEGTGLGLSLVASMAKLHGGRVSVESELGQGSIFTITLPWKEISLPPLRADADSLPSSSTPASPPLFGTGPLVLIAEDNEANIVTMSMYLQATGYHIAIARDGFEALDLARTKHPALILMDLQMPGLNGLQTIQRLRQETDQSLAKMPIIAITAFAMPADRERALEAGANVYLSKPVNMKNLLEVINRFVPKIPQG